MLYFQKKPTCRWSKKTGRSCNRWPPKEKGEWFRSQFANKNEPFYCKKGGVHPLHSPASSATPARLDGRVHIYSAGIPSLVFRQQHEESSFRLSVTKTSCRDKKPIHATELFCTTCDFKISTFRRHYLKRQQGLIFQNNRIWRACMSDVEDLLGRLNSKGAKRISRVNSVLDHFEVEMVG